MAGRKVQYDITEYISYIKSGIYKHYKNLPDGSKLVYSFEDVCQEALAYVQANLKFFDPKRAQLKTYIFMITERFCSHVIKAQYAAKRQAVLVPLEDLKAILGRNESITSALRVKEAIEKVRLLHLHASPELMDFIDDNLYHPTSNRIQINRTDKDFTYKRNVYTKGMRKHRLSQPEIFLKRKLEFRELAARHKVTIDDYRLALRAER